MITIDSDVNLEETPIKRKKLARNPKYPFDQMAVGNSFHVPKTEDDPNPANKLGVAVCKVNKQLTNKKFVVRTVDETDPKGPGARAFREK